MWERWRMGCHEWLLLSFLSSEKNTTKPLATTQRHTCTHPVLATFITFLQLNTFDPPKNIYRPSWTTEVLISGYFDPHPLLAKRCIFKDAPKSYKVHLIFLPSVTASIKIETCRKLISLTVDQDRILDGKNFTIHVFSMILSITTGSMYHQPIGGENILLEYMTSEYAAYERANQQPGISFRNSGKCAFTLQAVDEERNNF